VALCSLSFPATKSRFMPILFHRTQQCSRNSRRQYMLNMIMTEGSHHFVLCNTGIQILSVFTQHWKPWGVGERLNLVTYRKMFLRAMVTGLLFRNTLFKITQTLHKRSTIAKFLKYISKPADMYSKNYTL